MIRSLKRKFVLLAMLSLTLLLAVIGSGMSIISYRALVAEADEMLELVSANRDDFPAFPRGKIPPGMSPEAPYEARFFSVLLGPDKNIIEVHMARIATIDRDAAVDYAAEAIEKGKSHGFIGDFRYVLRDEGEFSRITFLDCGRKLHAFSVFMYASIVMSLMGLGLVFALMLFFSERIISPVAESYEKQKRFITDAGHEIKTPLTIISANSELLEMDIGENEYLSEIQSQTKRLGRLTGELVYLARMEEAGHTIMMVELPISDLVLESVDAFSAVALGQEKELVCSIEPMLSLRADHKALDRLISILMDNALKYSPAGSKIYVALSRQGRSIRLSVKNSCVSPLSPKDIKQLFQRFYRADGSHSSASGGYGIGLSVAAAIAAAHNAKIHAGSEDGRELDISVNFPV